MIKEHTPTPPVDGEGEINAVIDTLVDTYLAKIEKPRNDTELEAYNRKVSKLKEVAARKISAVTEREAHHE